jgi:hypothetical protein
MTQPGLKLALLSAVALPLALTSCGGSSKPDEMTSAYCPQPMTVGDVQRLTRFKDGPGRDPRDVVFEAAIAPAGAACVRRDKSMEVELNVRVVATAGPSIGAGQIQVPYFVRVVDGRGQVVQGQDFIAEFRLSAAEPRKGSQEELRLRLPFQQIADVAAYRIAVGLKPTQDELQYNRRGGAR